MKDKIFLKFTDDMLKMAEYTPPNIDSLKEDIFSYAKNLRESEIPEKNKQSMLKEYVEEKVSLFFNQYKTKYKQNDEIIENINEKIKFDTENIKDLENKINEKEKELDFIEGEKESIENEINNISLKTTNKPTFYEKFTLVFFVVIALGLAILSAYEFSITLSKIEALSNNESLNNIHISPFKYGLFLLGSFSILIASKAISLLYEKFNHSKKFFISIVTLSILLAMSSAFLLSFDKSFLSNRSNVITKIQELNKKIESQQTLASMSGETPKSLKNLQAELAKYEKILEKENQKSIKLYMLVTILILLSEIFAGAVAWTYVAEFDHKYNKFSKNSLLKSYKDKLKSLENEKKEISKEKDELNKEYIDLKEEIHRLNLVLSKIKSEEEIEKILENYKNTILKEAQIMLWKSKDS